MNLETEAIHIEKTDVQVFNFLNDVKNFEQLMPESITKFETINENTILFALKGMPEIKLQKQEVVPHNKIVLGADESSKIKFSLTAVIQSLTSQTTQVQLQFNGAFNPMMSMMVKKPLTAFITTLGSNLKVIK